MMQEVSDTMSLWYLAAASLVLGGLIYGVYKWVIYLLNSRK
ncbi:MAG: hypothetical protein ACKVLH_05655 [Bacteroidia bacterium]